jgi:hypothetical protein
LPRKQNINSVEVHPQLNNNGHPMDGALVGAGLLWPRLTNDKQQFHFGAYTELCLIFRMGTKSSVFFKKNWTQNWIFSNLFV